MEMNENYWPQFYKEHQRMKPSQFAMFCLSRIKKGSKILDIGAGDGRDSMLLKERGDVVAVEPGTDLPGKVTGVRHYQSTFENFLKSQEADHVFDVVYARWFIHAVPEMIEEKVLYYCEKNKATLMAEFRIFGDEPDDTHDRRLIDIFKFQEKLFGRGYIIKHLEVGRGLSKHGTDDPYLARIIAEYKGR